MLKEWAWTMAPCWRRSAEGAPATGGVGSGARGGVDNGAGGDAEAGGGRSPHRRRGCGTAVSTTSGARRRVEGGKGAEGGEPCG